MNVDLRLGDCLEILPTLADNSVDAVITDPPYNVKFKYGDGGEKDNKKDYFGWCERWFEQLNLLHIKAITLSCGIVNLAMWAKIKEFDWIFCWWKPAAMGRSPVGFCNWEPMPFWGKVTSRNGVDVVRATILPDKSLSGHPCPKPLKWATGFVELISNPGDTILDPFMGSGTTGVACVQTGRNFIGIEIEPKYFEIAEKRIAEAQLQMRMPI